MLRVMRRTARRWSWVAVCAVLAGCGGGGAQPDPDAGDDAALDSGVEDTALQDTTPEIGPADTGVVPDTVGPADTAGSPDTAPLDAEADAAPDVAMDIPRRDVPITRDTGVMDGPARDAPADRPAGDARADAPTDAGMFTFTRVHEVLFRRCVICHGTNGRLDMTTRMLAYRNLVGVGAMGPSCMGGDRVRVVAGDPARSLLLEKVNPMPSCGARMPRGAMPLTAAEIALIRGWIAAGARND
jgi:hypothetical protein